MGRADLADVASRRGHVGGILALRMDRGAHTESARHAERRSTGLGSAEHRNSGLGTAARRNMSLEEGGRRWVVSQGVADHSMTAARFPSMGSSGIQIQMREQLSSRKVPAAGRMARGRRSCDLDCRRGWT